MAFKVVNDSVITDLKQGLLENLSIDSTLVLERDPTSGNIVLRNVELDSATVDISGYTTDDIAEGSANLYYTDARAQAVSINALSEDPSPLLSANLDVNNLSIVNLSNPVSPNDASNKAYVDATVVAVTGLLTTDNISEGTTNLYFTDQRAQDALAGNLAAVAFAISQAEADAIAAAALDATAKADQAEVNANAYTDLQVSNLVDAAPGALDTLNELAAALGDDPNFATTITNAIATSGTSSTAYTDAREVAITTAYQTYTDQAEADAIAAAALDATAKANAAQTAAESYTDSREIAITASYQAYADIAESDAITSSNAYTDTQISQLGNTYYTETESNNLFVNVSGDTMTGALVLSGAPVNPNDAATKSYVDNVVSTGTGSLTTDDIPEASNLYYTDTRAQAAITGGTGVTVTNGVVSVGQDVATTSDVEFHDVVIAGDLTVQGTTTTINAQELAIQDNLIYLNEGSTVTNPDLGWSGNYNDGTYRHAGMFRDATDGVFKAFEGYTLEPGQAIDTAHASFSLADIQASTFIGDLTGDVTGNLIGNVTGTVSSIANHSTTDLSEGSNLYYTDARVDARIPTTVSSFTNDSGYITNISGFTTTNLAEGTNKYYTDERVDDRVNALVQAGQNISVVYNDALNTLTISAATQAGGGYDLSNNTTDDVAEGATNLYFTAARTQTIIDANTAGFATTSQLFSGNYNDLTNKPTIPTVPTNVSAFTNDAGYLTSETDSQTLTFNSPNLSISNGNTVDLSALLDDTNTNDYVDGASFNAINGNLTLTRTGSLSDITVNLDGRYVTPINAYSGWELRTNNTSRGNIDTDEAVNFIGGDNITVGYSSSFGNHITINAPTNVSAFTNDSGYLTSHQSLAGYATETYVNTAVSNLVDSAPGALDTLNELAAALGDDPNFATTVTNSIATKQDSATALTTNTAFGGDVSGTYNNIVIANNSHDHTGLLKRADIPGSADLNSYTTDGYYHQNSNANASSGSNYPVALAGMLTVQADGAMVYQKYHVYNGTGTYQRTYYNGTWYGWEKLWDNTNDGAGSGLDADLLDGKHASEFLLVGGKAADANLLDGLNSTAFLRSNANDSTTGSLTITNDGGLTIRTATNGAGAKIDFSDNQSGAYAQVGTITYVHTDTASHGANNAFLVTGTEPAMVFHVDGSIIATGDVTAYSDERLKDNIENINNAMDKVDQLRGVTFTHKDTGNESTGLIAQDVQSVLPEAVSEDADGYLAVKYGNMTGLLVEAMKELKDRLEVLEAENAELKAKLNS